MRNLFLFFIILVLTTCGKKDDPYLDEGNYKPILMHRKDLDKSIKLEHPRDIQHTGKIYFRDPYILLSEQGEGVHIIDNSDPANPENLAFIRVQGCTDIAMKGNVIYAEHLTDLVAIQFTSINSISVTGRVEELFPELNSPDGYIPNMYQKSKRPGHTVIVAWEKR
ncbi:MAG: hypothetical protein ACK4ND_03945 [Cytophagaceae bacterium]